MHRSFIATMMPPKKIVGGGPSGYQGLGDVVGGAILCWSMRAYDAAHATAGTEAFMMRGTDPASAIIDADVTCLPDGTLDSTDYDTPGVIGPPYSIPAIYDQIGSHDIATAISWDDSAIGGTPAYVFHPGFTGGAVVPLVQVQPLSIIAVVRADTLAADKCFLGTADDGGLYGPHFSWNALSGAGGANTLHIYGGSDTAAVAVPDDAYHSIQVVFNGASSKASVNGAAPTTLTPAIGALGYLSALHFGMHAGFGGFFQGGFGEVVIYPSDVVTANYAAIYANHAAYFGV